MNGLVLNFRTSTVRSSGVPIFRVNITVWLKNNGSGLQQLQMSSVHNFPCPTPPHYPQQWTNPAHYVLKEFKTLSNDYEAMFRKEWKAWPWTDNINEKRVQSIKSFFYPACKVLSIFLPSMQSVVKFFTQHAKCCQIFYPVCKVLSNFLPQHAKCCQIFYAVCKV